MKKLLLTSALTIAVIASTNARDVQSLNMGWQFTSDSTEWRNVDLPHDFQIEQPWVAPNADERPDNSDGAANVKSRLSSRGFKEMAKGTYKKNLHIGNELKGKRVLLDFGGIMLVGDVWINGTHAGGTDYGYLGFEIDATNLLNYGADNEIVVVADTGQPLNSRWYTGGGLYRDVKLVVTDKDLHFNRHGLQIGTSDISDEKATVTITADLNVGKPNNSFIAQTTITDPDGNVVATNSEKVEINPKWRSHEFQLSDITVENPARWDLETPNLYTANVKILREDNTVADELEETFGIRTIEFSPDFGLKLNGKKVLLKGIANHHTLGALGAAAYPKAMEKRIKMLKDFGFNHIRTSHNPYSEEFLDLCDQNGILVVDELYDKWLTQYAGGRKEWTALWQENVPEWVKRDRNHPSVIVWSLGNELQGYNNLPFNDWGVTAYKLQKTLLDKYDTTRPVTVAMHPRYRDLDTDSLPAPLVKETDIAAYNYRYMYFPGDAKRFPNMIFYQSEANLANMGPNFYEPDNDKILGLAYWGMIDYLGESFGWPAKGFNNGVFDISLLPKPTAYFIKAMFTDEPMVHLGVVTPKTHIFDWNGVPMGSEIVSENWNLAKGDTVKLYTYTNADEVVLKINGKQVGRKTNDKTNPKKRSRIVWDKIPFTPGTVEAIAYSDGKEVSRHKLQTAGKPVKLVAETDNSQWKADGNDLQHIRIFAVDNKGNRNPLCSDELRFKVDGDARIAAVSNGDITSDELNVQDSRKLFEGAALVILRAGQTPGNVALYVESDNFKPLKLEMNTVE